MTEIYIPFYSRYGNTEQMALAVAEGVRESGGEARLAYTGDPITPEHVRAEDARWEETHRRLEAQYPRASSHDLEKSDGAIFGSPTCFGIMSAQLKGFFDMLGRVWRIGACNNKPAGCFSSASAQHGGQEITNYTMWPVLAHLGFIIVGICNSTPELFTTTTGGGPYGPSHTAGVHSDVPLDEVEKILCRALGGRVTAVARAMTGAR